MSKVLEVAGAYTAATTTTPHQVAFDVPRAETLKLAHGVRRYWFEVRATAGVAVVTVARGILTVLPGAA